MTSYCQLMTGTVWPAISKGEHMKPLLNRVRNASRNEAVGLTIIGLMMLVCSYFSETIPDKTLGEGPQVALIFGGILATGILFGRKE
jgi:hypothetical protein